MKFPVCLSFPVFVVTGYLSGYHQRLQSRPKYLKIVAEEWGEKVSPPHRRNRNALRATDPARPKAEKSKEGKAKK